MVEIDILNLTLNRNYTLSSEPNSTHCSGGAELEGVTFHRPLSTWLSHYSGKQNTNACF